LQQHPNNELRRYPTERRKGILGAVIIHSVLFVLLVLASFSVMPPKEEEGILVNFGTDDSGLGMIEPSEAAVQESTTVPVPPSATEKQTEEALLTQNTEEAPEVKKVDPDAEKKRLEKIEADRKRREELEAERIQKQKEEAERLRIAAEQQRQTDIVNRTRNALANARNAGTNSTSEGVAGGTGNQGSPTGSVDSKVRGDGSGLGDKGISYDLQGRGFQSLPSPKYDYQGEGKVVVEVSVDRTGKVISATPGIKGSTTLDEYLLKVAKDAALEARFDTKTDAPLIQKGTITYNFILR